MKRKMKATRITAILLAMIVFLNNEQIMYALAATADSQVISAEKGDSLTTDDGSSTSENEGESTEPEEGSEAPTPGKENATPTPGEGSEMPTPGEGSEAPTPGEGSEAPTPGEENATPTPGEGSEAPTPGKENATPTPGEGSEMPTPGEENATPTPGSENESPVPGDDDNIGNEEEECEHEWMTDPETMLIICSKCGKEQTEEDLEHGDAVEKCEHEWVIDPETMLVICSKCGKEQTEEDLENGALAEECEHEWIRDPETLSIICSICGEYNLQEEEECPEGGFHIYELKEDGTGYVCAICGAEKESLDALDVTMEMYLNSSLGKMETLGVTDADDPASSKLPKTLAELENYSKELIVASLGDLLVVQELSKQTDFKGYTIRMSQRTIGDITLNNSIYDWDLRNTPAFEGLGCEEFPFSGTFKTGYQGVNYKTDKPFFQYLSTDAQIVNSMNIVGTILASSGDGPQGILAGVLIRQDKDDSADTFMLDNVLIEGSVSHSSGAAGMVFGRVEAPAGRTVNLTFGSGARLCQDNDGIVSGLHAGGVAGESAGDVTWNIADSGLTGKVVVQSANVWSNSNNESGNLEWDKTGAGGMYVGAMDGGTLVIQGSSTPYTVHVKRTNGNGGANGGFVGMAIGTNVITNASANNQITISGTGVEGRIAGGILGYYDHSGDKAGLQLDHITVATHIKAAGVSNDYFAGGILGRYNRNEAGAADGTFDIIDHITVANEAAVEGYYFAGGIAGAVHGSNLRIGGSDADSISVIGKIINNSTWGTESNPCGAGGVAGHISGQYVEVQNAVVQTSFSQGAQATGGIVGAVGKIKSSFDDKGRNSIIKITNAKVASSFGNDNNYSSRSRGGLLGMVYSGSMVCLDGTIDVAGMNLSSTISRFERTGHIAGYQNEALIYLEKDAVYQRPAGKQWVDDIGSYGGLYRNGLWGEQTDIFNYNSGMVTGGVGKSGNTWVIDSEADFIRLAVMLNTQGNYAAGCFGNVGKEALLGADYSVTKSLDLKESGIYSLNRNDKTGMNELFSGSFKGTGSSNVVINLGDLKTRQSYLALFVSAGGGSDTAKTAEFSGFTLKRTIDGASLYGAGIACQVTGNFKAKDLYIDLTSDDPSVGNGIHTFYGGKISGDNNDLYNLKHYYAGLAARVDSKGATTFIADSVRISGTLRGNSNTTNMFMAGMVAEYVQTVASPSLISVNEFELMGDFKLITPGCTASGMITNLNAGQGTGAAGMNLNSTKLSMKNITVHNGAVIEENLNTNNANGGWLGRIWKNVIPDEASCYSIDGITIGDGGGAADGPRFTSKGVFGGLVDTVTGRIQIKNVNIQNGIFNKGSTSGNRVGLLFRVGNSALIEIDGYTIGGRALGDMNAPDNSGSVQVTGCTNTYFDEIVASNIDDGNNYQTGGIVNIIYDGFSKGAAAEHKTYQNRLLPSNNGSTRYYYNLFGNSFAGENTYLSDSEKLTQENGVITNERQMMVWHLAQYMNNSVRGYLQPYYQDALTNILRNKNTTFKGKIDLSTVSYYPTSISSGTYTFAEKPEIVFYGEDITNKATSTMTPASGTKEHYMMHAGMFLSKSGAVTVQGADASNFLTLRGSVTNLGTNSGALFCRDITGTKNIYRVCFDGLYLAEYNGSDPAGLMIGIVNDASTLDLSWIETKGYESFSGKKAASALIARVGTTEARKISIEFRNIKIDSRKEGIFQFASLIDQNYYLEDTQNQSAAIRRIRYLFTKSAFLGTDNSGDKVYPFDGTGVYGNDQYSTTGSYVTIGSELAEGVEYWDVEEGPVDGISYPLPFLNSVFTWKKENVENTYLPYVHIDAHEGSKEIEVNPKNVSIKEGCGTYEDPYVISRPKQLLALARYLQNQNDYKYLGGWQINVYQSGRNGGICNKVHTESDLRTYPQAPGANGVVTLPEGFPTREQLSQAYYIITDDIDLSAMTNATDRQIAEDFVGLGTTSIPFRGVIIGKNKGSGVVDYPTITLPLRRNWSGNVSDVNHGLIQYAKGAVVKDLTIKGADDSTDRTGVARVRSMAGGVIACILGGDNIIDNVSVNLKVALVDPSAQAGAYVGNVRQGSLILRNLNEDSAKGFQTGIWKKDNVNKFTSFTNEELEKRPYVSGLIGKVEDGCVIYDDTYNSGTPYSGGKVLAHDAKQIESGGITLYSNAALPICKHYDIIVKSQLDRDINGKIVITDSTDAGGKQNYNAAVKNAAGLQIVSMAINSDAFSVYYKSGGYQADAACRKADYDEVGDVSSGHSGPGSDFKAATTEDDAVYYYPYLYDYFDFQNSGGREATLITATDSEGRSGFISKLNAATKEIEAIMNYTLSSGTYELSVYDRGFRGLGATYGMLETILSHNSRVSSDKLKDTFYSDFRANFHGGGAVIQIDIDRTYDDSIHVAALFNDLLDRTAAGNNLYTIENFTITGRVVSVIHKYNTKGDEITGNSAYCNRTSAVIGFMRRPWKLKDITVKNMTIEASGHTGGIVAWIEPEANKNLSYEFENLRVLENTHIDSYGGSAGGLVGIMTQNYDTKAFNNVSLNLKGCVIEGTADKQVEIAVRNRTADRGDTDNAFPYNHSQIAAGRSGGLVGYIGSRFIGYGNPAVGVVIENNGSANTKISYAQITGAYSTGGLIGEYNGTETSTVPSGVTIMGTQVENCRIEGTRGNTGTADAYYDYGVGGVMGQMRGYSFKAGENQEITVSNTDIISSDIDTASSPRRYGMFTGGVIGSLRTHTAELEKIRVQGTVDTSAQASLELGGQKYTIRSGITDAGGVIGRAIGSTPNPAPTLKMSDIQVTGMNIAVDNRKDQTAFAVAGSVGGRAGGVIGTCQVELTIEGAAGGSQESGAKVENCMITASGNNVGGILGAMDKCYNDNKMRSTCIRKAAVTNCIIGYNNIEMLIKGGTNSGVGAGGIYGKIPYISNNAGQHRLENVLVSDCWIYGANTGGILGYVGKYVQLCSNETGSETNAGITVSKNKIYGWNVGGAIGYLNASKANYIGVDIKNNWLQAYSNASNVPSCVGGFAGWAESADGADYRLDFIAVKENHILAANINNAKKNKLISAGGFFGYSSWSQGYVYRTKLSDNLIGCSETDHGGDLITAAKKPGTGTLQILFGKNGEIAQGSREVFLITGTNVDQLKTVAMPAVSDLRSHKIGYYAGRIGNFVGCHGTGAHTYFLAPEVTYTDTFNGTRPVIDVGMTTGQADGTQEDGSKLLGNPYAYRAYIHIIYHEPEKTTNSDAAVWSKVTINAADQTKLGITDNKECLFNAINYQKIIEDYRAVETTSELSSYLDVYRLDAKADAEGSLNIEGVYDKLYRSDQGLQSRLRLNDNEVLPVIVLDTQHGTADQLVKGVVAALTGVGGVYNCDEKDIYSPGMGQITKIETKAMKLASGVVSVDDGKMPSLEARKTSGGKWIVEYKGYDDDGYDLDGNFSGTQTFTLLTVTYSWTYKTLGGQQTKVREEKIRIPIFVVERLTIDTHLKITEGFAYNVNKVKEEGLCSSKVLVASDSSYTLYTEYIYGDARKKYDVAIDKQIGSKQDVNGTMVDKGFAPGTRLTLIDVDGGNKVYYYTVKEGEHGPVSYTQFTDENGKAYVNKKINQDQGFSIYGENDTFVTTDTERTDSGVETTVTLEYSKVAVERFLINVDISEAVKNKTEITDAIRFVDTSPVIAENLKPKTTLTEHSNMQMTIQPGLTINFAGKNKVDQQEKTWVEGSIKASEREGFVDIWATLNIEADTWYWNAVSQNGANTIDSANNDKYLELQIYMTAPGSDQEISLPAGTNVSIEGVRTRPEGIYVNGIPDSISTKYLDPYYNTANIYYYKDGKLQFKLNDLRKLILAEIDKNNRTEGVIRWVDKLRLDFRNADMTPYDKEKYTMHLNLLRIEDSGYPVGGEILDTYEKELQAARKEDLACAVETKDLMQLGVNTYENQTKMPHTIDYDFKLDFNGILTGVDATDKVLTDKYYTVVYRIWEKTDTGGTTQYVPYTGDQLEIELVDDPDGKTLEKTVSTNADTSNIPFWYVDYDFDWNEIKNGTGQQGKGVVVRNLKLTVKNASLMDLSNYKVQAIVYVNTKTGWNLNHQLLELNTVTPLSDFFIFTVAKLKTDLDY